MTYVAVEMQCHHMTYVTVEMQCHHLTYVTVDCHLLNMSSDDICGCWLPLAIYVIT